jgi:hypothetical protein
VRGFEHGINLKMFAEPGMTKGATKVDFSRSKKGKKRKRGQGCRIEAQKENPWATYAERDPAGKTKSPAYDRGR